MQKLPDPPRRNNGGGPIPLTLDCKPFRVTGLTERGKPFYPKENQLGFVRTFATDGGVTLRGQVWSLGPYPKSVWVVADSAAYLINSDGYVLRDLSRS